MGFSKGLFRRASQFKSLGFVIDLKLGVISKARMCHRVRAKTLQVLQILLLNNHQIVSKQRLLEAIWQDVVVQEQVLTQSIKELRDIFGADAIKTFPKAGYQWVAPVRPLVSVKASVLVLASCCAIVIALLSSLVATPHKAHLNIAFLPVENAIPDEIHQWVPLRGMEYLSQQLQHHSDLQVIGHDQVLYALEYSKATASLQPTEDMLVRLQRKLAANLIVLTRITGYPQDYQLHYTLVFEHSIEKGVEFAQTIEQSFDKLIAMLAKRYAEQYQLTGKNWHSDFSNEAFARGVELYLQQAYQQAIPLLSSALQVEPNLLAARRYLAASYANLDRQGEAIAILQHTIELPSIENTRELIRAHLMIGYLLINWPQGEPRVKELQDAQSHIEQAQKLAQNQQDKLFIAYTYEELGKIKRLQGQFEQATQLITQALEYHQSFYGQYGQTAALIELARVKAEQGQFSLANQYLKQAQDIADDNGAPANQIWVLLAKADIARLQNELIKAEQYAVHAQSIARHSDQPHLISRVEDWFNDRSPYSLN
ncbi:tetratricopeptide repeat protein [Pseudoalteromonas sp. T1lg23B]|uniref:tetratricopeptide repeat protein n=1 Tax=Pseudoalteromonas sp. T1lg23B TaxID=2077097 RepID=UPI000CF6025D|nr:tetratricopeptide repeat protein [Pseudoalteromonas sp. T1lg23B]